MAYSQRLSAGIAQTISRRINTNVLYSYGYRYSLLIGRNLNTPVNGVRPFPEFANVVLASPDGKGAPALRQCVGEHQPGAARAAGGSRRAAAADRS